MTPAFYAAAGIALVATARAVTHTHAIVALLYLISSFLATALMFFSLGASLVAALEVILYAGAIIVLFIFVVMMLGLGSVKPELSQRLRSGRAWVGPTIVASSLGLPIMLLAGQSSNTPPCTPIWPELVATRLLGPYLFVVESASFLLLVGLVAAFHLARSEERKHKATRSASPAAATNREAGVPSRQGGA